MSRISCLLDDHRGIYLPRDFCKDFRFGPDSWANVDPEDIAICTKGPDEELYWEAWDSILKAATYTTNKPTKIQGTTYPAGHIFRLEQDGDLFMVDDSEE